MFQNRVTKRIIWSGEIGSNWRPGEEELQKLHFSPDRRVGVLILRNLGPTGYVACVG